MKFPCPLSALPIIAAELRKFGVLVTFEAETFGMVEHAAGLVCWQHDGTHLQISIIEDKGHFPRRLLFGGIRQLVSEAVELQAN